MMRVFFRRLAAVAFSAMTCALFVGCAEEPVNEATTADARRGSFGADLEFLTAHTDAFVLSDAAGEAQAIVVPAYQGRVMTSTNSGPDGPSFGWLNRDLIQSSDVLDHMNPYGGEDRFWLGPEGGQFAIFFKEGDPFDLDHWQTPALIDTEPFDLVEHGNDSAVFEKTARLVNYSGTEFQFRIRREVRLIDAAHARELLGLDDVSGLDMVGFETVNTLENTGTEPWEKDTGLLSIWILGMFKPSPETTIAIPIEPGPVEELGPKVNDAYFGKVPADRLRVLDEIVYFRGDGEYRSKIGIPPQRAKPVCGSYDATARVLTIVQFNLGVNPTDYVNSMWEIQDEPYGGDVVNSYNDGPPEPGAKPLGPFYELETSSPAAALAPGESITHIPRTFHFQGDPADLDRIAEPLLGVTVAEIAGAFEDD